MSNLPVLALIKLAAETSLDHFKSRYTHDDLLSMSAENYQGWKAEMMRRWEAVIDAQLAYYRAKDEVRS